MSVRIINSPEIKSLGVYNQAVQVTGGSLLFVSGCVPVDGEGNLVGRGDPAAQMRRILTNIRTILEEAGTGLENVVKVTVFSADLDNRKAMNEVRLEMFGEHPHRGGPPHRPRLARRGRVHRHATRLNAPGARQGIRSLSRSMMASASISTTMSMWARRLTPSRVFVGRRLSNTL